MAASTKTVRVELTGDPSSLERSLTVVSEKSAAVAGQMEGHANRMGGAFGKLDGLLGQFGIPFTGALSTIGGKLDEVGTRGTSAFEKISHAGGLALAGLAAAAVGIGVESIHLADSFEKSHAALENSLKNLGTSYDANKSQIDALTATGQKFGYNQTEVEGALAKSSIALGSVDKGATAVRMAWDASSKTGKDFNTTVLLATKALEGQTGPLKRAGIDLPIVAGGAAKLKSAQDGLAKASEAARLVEEKVADGRLKGQAASDALKAAYERLQAANQKVNDTTDAGKNIQEAWNQKFGGGAAAAAETFQGKVKALTAELENIGIKIGMFLIPIVEDLVGAISDVISWFEKHKTAAEVLAGVITTVLGAAIAIFVYDKVAAFVSGIGRMIDGLTSLMTKSGEAAAAVEADGATMAASSTAGGAGAAAGGAGAAAGGEGAAVGEGAAAGGAGLLAFAAGAALVIGVGAGLARTFGFVDDESVKVNFNLGNMASQSVPQLSAKFEDLTGHAHSMNRALDDNKASTLATKTEHDAFNKILDQSPGFAAKFIAGVQGAGQSTEWYSKKLQEHVVASEEARVAQERFAIQAEIVDARARGDAGAVYGLTLQLNALPTDKQIEVAAHTAQAYSDLVAFRQAVDSIDRNITVAVKVIGDAPGKAFGGP